MYKSIFGYPGYFISEKGIVISLKKGKIKYLSVNISTSGYKRVNLSVDGKFYNIEIHVLIAIAYYNHRPGGYKLVVDHIDIDRLNNNVENIRLVSLQENCTNRIKKGTIWYNKKRNNYRASISHKKKRTHVGTFTSRKEAKYKLNEYIKINKI